MKIEGKIDKVGKWWAVEVPLLAVFSQGKTKKEALSMIGDAIETLVDKKGFRVGADLNKGNSFNISSNDDTALMAFALQQQRAKHNLTIREIARRLGSKSPTAYSRYEKGQVKPSLDKFSELLKAINADLEPILKVS